MLKSSNIVMAVYVTYVIHGDLSSNYLLRLFYNTSILIDIAGDDRIKSIKSAIIGL